MPASRSSLTACHCNLCLHTVSVLDSGPANHGRAPDPPFALRPGLLLGRLQLRQRAEGEQRINLREQGGTMRSWYPDG